MSSRKRIHEPPSILRKRGTKQRQLQGRVEVKRRRLTYLSDHLLIFQINQSFRVESKKTPNDCFVCTLEYLDILDNDMANMLRTFVTGKGVYIDQMLSVLKYTLRNKYRQIQNEYIPFDSIYLLFDLLVPSSATIIGFTRPGAMNNIGHIVLLAKDVNSRIGIIDPQMEFTCVQEQCEDYVKPFQNSPILIFTHS